jgi:uncharacterized membrane protein YeaQ/YmgE (transglycosylase-associated protein family)
MIKEARMLTLAAFSAHFAVITITTAFIVYLVVAAIVGLVAEFIIGWRLPFGVIGAIIAALVGVWLLTNVINLSIAGDPNIYGVPIIKALIGAIVLVGLWHLLTYRTWRRRRRYGYYRRRY